MHAKRVTHESHFLAGAAFRSDFTCTGAGLSLRYTAGHGLPANTVRRPSAAANAERQSLSHSRRQLPVERADSSGAGAKSSTASGECRRAVGACAVQSLAAPHRRNRSPGKGSVNAALDRRTQGRQKAVLRAPMPELPAWVVMRWGPRTETPRTVSLIDVVLEVQGKLVAGDTGVQGKQGWMELFVPIFCNFT